jgi:Zn-dependent peptidase ImmA (M78 family)
MVTRYVSALRRGTMAAARLHQKLGIRADMKLEGGGVDVFGAILALDLPLVFRPLKGLLGAYIPEPIPGVLVTTERPLSIQRFTAAHELGHFRLAHLPSLDDENILRRMTLSGPSSLSDGTRQEIEADAFAVEFLMPRWLVAWHCRHQAWGANDLRQPQIVYQLALRLGTSYEATTWTLQRYGLIPPLSGKALREVPPRALKADLLSEYRPGDYRGDVWLLTERDGATRIDGSRNDHFVLKLTEHTGGGYLWNIDQLKESGFAVVRDGRHSTDEDGVGGPTTREVTAMPVEAQRGRLALAECRPWQPTQSLTELVLDYDFTGPEETGFSRAERRQALKAA